jgi:RNA polymerase sigma-70 factor (ECF subfamily)
VTLAASWIAVQSCAASQGELDAETLAECRAGSPRALRVFVVRYQHVVFAYLSRTLGAGPHVEDLAQEVFLRACRGLARFEVGGAARPSTWLLTIASRVAIDARRRRRLPTAVLSDDLAAASDGTPETERRRSEIGRALARAAAQLTDEQRDVFVLAEFHDLDTAAIARVLGIREATARTRLFRARERLRELLQSQKEAL